MADGATPETKTTIDSMIELLKGRGKMELTQISEALDVDPTIVENWAKVLERGNLVKISYEVGKMFVTPYGFTPEQESSAKTETKEKAASIESAASSGLLSLDSLSETLKNIRGSIAAAEKLEMEQMPQMRQALAQINSIYENVDQRTRAIDQMSKRADELYEEINKRATDLASGIAQIESTGAGKTLDDARQSFAQIMSDAGSLDKQIAQMGKSANETISQMRKGMDEQMQQLRQQMDSNRREIDAKTKEYSKQLSDSEQDIRNRVKSAGTVIQQANEFEREKEKINKRINDIRVEFNDAYAKTLDEINRSRAQLDTSSKSLLEQIDSVRKAFGGAAELDDSITRSKAELASIESDIATQKQALNGILAQLHGLDSIGADQLERKKAMLENIQGSSDKAASNLSNLKKRTRKASQVAEDIGKKEDGLDKE